MNGESQKGAVVALRGVYLSKADLGEAGLNEASLKGAEVTQEQLDQAKTLEDATLPDGTKYIDEAEAAPAKPETTGTEEQQGQPAELDADSNDHA